MAAFDAFNRRSFLQTGGLALIGAPSLLRAAAPDRPMVEADDGRLLGIHDRGVKVFRGIPYAGSVSGTDRRFRPPVPPPTWSGIRDASAFGAPSLQPAGQPMGPGRPAPAEDCLFLNVWTPALDGKPRPVMVYQHGGGFVVGSGAAPWQDAARLAAENDVVVVQSNHRLGIMGYLYLGQMLGEDYPGNQGLMDLVMVLRWVGRNIAAFGGDPGNVTIFGESGGGGKTACLYTMPSAAPYFHKASIESPIGPGHMDPDAASAVTREVMKRLGISDAKALLSLPAEALMKAQAGDDASAQPGTTLPGQPSGPPSLMFWPFIDGTILPEEPFARSAPAISAHKPLIIGGCRDEAVFFNRLDPAAFRLDEAGLFARVIAMAGPRAGEWIASFRASRPHASPSQLYMAIATAAPWRAHAIHIAEAKARQHGAPAYAYILDYRDPTPVEGTAYPQGSPHASDIPMKFNTAPEFGPRAPARLKTAQNMSQMWAYFAHTGRPAAKGQPQWPAYTLERRETMIIDAQCRVARDPEGAERRFFMQQPDAEAIR
ncbi:carboxylesterase/lipase family protein [Novosphingobium sediminicola]|uniref:Carboxylic ester hydrolase n=1 Tax=Novosphingobium sediminicola TaxID=563162 RepID=A0A7W6CEB0_9SPHN|nr:carboxylesterase family protein [Novosphingobium sediminicola]MBB3954257.1 para-nitrobenzyl esterase [Novosphingobium sediminicola]